MTDHLVFYVGDRDPDLTDTILVDGEPADLTGASGVTFKLRALGASAFKVNAAGTIVTAASGIVRYSWGATDLDTAGFYVGSWHVATSGQTLSQGEFLVEVRAHSPLEHCYLELEEMRQALSQTGTYADPTFRRALLAASRGIDRVCERRFWRDTDANQVRYYTPSSTSLVVVDDVETITSLQVDQDGDGTFEETWTANTEYLAEPLNAATDGWPFTRLETHPAGGKSFPGYPRSVKVTGRFGWPEVPAEIIQATSILAHILSRRERDAPFGIQTGGIDGAAVRIARTDPQVGMLTAPFVRHRIA